MEGTTSNTEYDDVFRTLLNYFPHLAIPLINEFFGTSYNNNDTVHLGNNELFILEADHKTRSLITDSSIYINNDYHHRFHIECQSTPDNSMIVRMFDYDSQIALNTSNSVENNTLTVTFPKSGILYLRSTSNTPDRYHIKILASQSELTYDVPTIKLKSFSLETIFKKKLLFLLPFYIFNLEHSFKHPQKGENYMQQINSDFSTIRQKLDELLKKEEINEYLTNLLRELINKVAEKIANKNTDVKEGVKNIMGGKIITTESTRIFNSGINQGISQGISQGAIQNGEHTAKLMFEDNEPIDKIIRYSRLSPERVHEIGVAGGFVKQ